MGCWLCGAGQTMPSSMEAVLQLTSINGCVGLALQSMTYANMQLTLSAVVGSQQRTMQLTSANCGQIPTSLAVCGVSNAGLMAAVNFGNTVGGMIMQVAGFGVPTWNACGLTTNIVAVVDNLFILSGSNGQADSCDMTQAPGLVGTSMSFSGNTLTLVFFNDTASETIVATGVQQLPELRGHVRFLLELECDCRRFCATDVPQWGIVPSARHVIYCGRIRGLGGVLHSFQQRCGAFLDCHGDHRAGPTDHELPIVGAWPDGVRQWDLVCVHHVPSRSISSA